LTTLINFDSTNGAGPSGGLIADANGDLFGTTSGGVSGTFNFGTVFELVNNNGTYALSTLVNFNSINGVYPNGVFPHGSLIADAHRDLFGATQGNGSNVDGTVFELINNNGTYTFNTLVDFSNFNTSNGVSPNGGLIADANGNLFGTTPGGGTNSGGTVFE